MGFFESDDHHKKYTAKEAMERSTNIHPHLFESDEDYLNRASKEVLQKASRTYQGLSESDHDYILRATKQATGIYQRVSESDSDYLNRVYANQAEKNSGIKRDLFESDEHYLARVVAAGGKQAPAAEKRNYTPCMAPIKTLHPAPPKNWKQLLIGSYSAGIILGVIFYFLSGFKVLEWVKAGNPEGYLILGSTLLFTLISILRKKDVDSSLPALLLWVTVIPWAYNALTSLRADGFGTLWVLGALFGLPRSLFYAITPICIGSLLAGTVYLIRFGVDKKKVRY